jgi:hypothetical protein
MANNFINQSFIIDFLYIIWITLLYGFFPFVVLSFAFAFYQVLMIKRLMKYVSKGFTFEEAEKRVKDDKK